MEKAKNSVQTLVLPKNLALSVKSHLCNPLQYNYVNPHCMEYGDMDNVFSIPNKILLGLFYLIDLCLLLLRMRIIFSFHISIESTFLGEIVYKN